MKTLHVFITCLFIGACAVSPQSQKDESLPNIVIIYTDDQGYADVNGFGESTIHTPNLDAMASEGLRLTQFYVAQPVCSASRAALLTGAYPNRVGVHGAFMPNSGQGLNLNETTLAELLKQKGYATALMGKWHLGDDPKFMPNKQGFDEFFGIAHSNDMWPYHPLQGSVFNFDDLFLFENEKAVESLSDQSQLTQRLTQKSLEFIEKNRERPFFLYLAHPQPHVPIYASETFQNSTKQGLYADVITELDWSVGKVIESLKKHGIDKNTLVIFTSDNGPWLSYGDHAGSAKPLREGKATVFEGGVRVPFVARWPEHIPAGISVNTPVMNIDILPTLAHVTGASLPLNKIDGQNILSILKGDSNKSPHEAYYFYFGQNELQAIRYGQWKLILPHTYKTLGNKAPAKNGQPIAYDYVKISEAELYNILEDPSESSNLAGEFPEVVKQIQMLADSVRKELGDSLTGVQGDALRPIGRVP